MKSHLPLDALPYYPQVKYIVVGRDARDVFMSFWDHYSNFTDATYAGLNDPRGRIGPPMPPCPQDIHECWTNWINRGWFEWESEGYPHSGNLYHTQS
jgi:aryl sulfotransferase